MNEVKCPKCKKELEELEVREEISGGLVYSLDGFEEDMELKENNFIFLCPECNEKLAYSQKEADEFLKGRDELTEIVKEKLRIIEYEKKNN